MAISDVIAHIDADILKLQQAKLVLMGGSTPAPVAVPARAVEVAAAPVKSGRRGRPKGSKNSKAVAVEVKAPATKAAAKTPKRKLSPEGRKAIADAMKRRWAERRKQPTK